MQPIVKWAGGKQWLAASLAAAVRTTGFRAYFEPFLGGASVFLAVRPATAVLSDSNAELIGAYIAVRDDPDAVIERLQAMPSDRDFYFEERRRTPTDPVASAARFLFLNWHSYNGLYRVNSAGDFNVPYGRYVNPGRRRLLRVREFAAALTGATLRTSDFEARVGESKAGDLVYLDPPYITGHTNNGFLKYNAVLFSWDDQLRLSVAALAAVERGASVIVSSAAHPAVADLYPFFGRVAVSRRSAIGGRTAPRGNVTELLLVSPNMSKEVILSLSA